MATGAWTPQQLRTDESIAATVEPAVQLVVMLLQDLPAAAAAWCSWHAAWRHRYTSTAWTLQGMLAAQSESEVPDDFYPSCTSTRSASKPAGTVYTQDVYVDVLWQLGAAAPPAAQQLVQQALRAGLKECAATRNTPQAPKGVFTAELAMQLKEFAGACVLLLPATGQAA